MYKLAMNFVNIYTKIIRRNDAEKNFREIMQIVNTNYI